MAIQTQEATRKAIFISHATPEDNHFVRWLGAKLTAIGYEVWADVMRLHGGADWSRLLEDALRKRSIKMLLVCTAMGMEKQGVRNEIEIATGIARQLSDDSFIIPLRLEHYEPPFRIAHAQYINFESSWAQGFLELLELLQNQEITKFPSDGLQVWVDAQTEGASKLLKKSEPLVSNWLEIQHQPTNIYFCEAPIGYSLQQFQNRQLHTWPLVPHRNGVITFSEPNSEKIMASDISAQVKASIDTHAFIHFGWPELGIDSFQAQRMIADITVQAFDKYCNDRGLKGYMGSGRKLSWWGDIKTAPLEKVKFDWGFKRGARQIIGASKKRQIHWHYAINVQYRSSPFRHLRVSSRLVFSENGLNPIEDTRRAHVLRRSFAKGWRNPRWRDMLCAFLWWLSDNKSLLQLGVGESVFIAAHIPPVQFSCPVSVDETNGEFLDEDDPDISPEEWIEEESGENEQ